MTSAVADATTPLANRFLTLRKARKEARERFLAGRKAEKVYSRQLKQVARQIGHIVEGMAPKGVVSDIGRLTQMLHRYAEVLEPWAESVASRMIEDVSRRDAAAWEAHGKAIGAALKQEIASAPTGQAMRQIVREQVEEITSLPRKAAQRLYKLTTEGITKGTRAEEIQAAVMRSGKVSIAQAKTLSRTAVSSTASALTEARARHIGCQGYFWRTSRDRAVRPSHRKMEGQFVKFSDPPTLDNYTAHCGRFANCRCFMEPEIPDRFGVK
jgi:SPP1 gp7 family putative phage head morphogenesis protein